MYWLVIVSSSHLFLVLSAQVPGRNDTEVKVGYPVIKIRKKRWKYGTGTMPKRRESIGTELWTLMKLQIACSNI